MSTLAKNRVLITIAIASLILISAAVAIFWARGFKPDFKKGQIERTGLIVASSIPTGATVYLDGRPTSATDTTITYLEPKIYKVRIEKDGYTTWEKDIEVKADLAAEIKALLLPTAPEIKPLTTTGAASPTLSPDDTKIVYGTGGERGGLFLLPMAGSPFPFRQDARLLAKNKSSLDFTKAKFIWSPDSKQVIARFEIEKSPPRLSDETTEAIANLAIDTEKTDQEPRDITASLNATLTSWQEELNSRAQTQATAVPESIKSATAEATLIPLPAPAKALESKPETKASNQLPKTSYQLNYFPTGLVFSPDEEKILYRNKEAKYKIYDLKTKKEFTLPDFADLINISWYPDSNHLVIAQNPPTGGLISIIETDGNNKMAVYTGKFENVAPPAGGVFAHPSGLRIIILTALTQQEGTPANLYSINLR